MNFEDMEKEELLNYIKRKQKTGLIWDRENEPEEIVKKCGESIPVLKEISEKNIENGDLNHILIEGDNFHALSVLNYTHKEKIDVIYIDPPYNTGKGKEKDFMYNDRWINEDYEYKHSCWLNFMEKRLKIAYNLLKEDGIICISIDENECAQLRLMCDEIFGDKNRLSTLHIQVRYDNKSLNEDNDWQPIMEYVYIYAKNKSAFSANKPTEEYDLSKFQWKINELKKGEEIFIGNRKVTIFKDGEWSIEKQKGKIGLLKETWASGSLIEQSGTAAEFLAKYLLPRKEIDGLNCLYKIDNMGEEGDGLGYRYVSGPKKANAIRGKYYSGVPLERIEEINNVGSSNKTRPIVNYYDYSAEFGNIRSEGGVSFNKGKKPIKLIKQLINYHKNKDAIVLDFFAGSGSTGHAVLDLNKQDGGNRKFILCTNNENNICSDKTYPRLFNVINGYSNKKPLKGNLKYYKTDFVKNEGTRDQKMYNLTQKCLPILCVKNDTFEKIESQDEYIIYSNSDKTKYTAVYFELNSSKKAEFIDKMTKIDGMKSLYIFTFSGNIDNEIFKEVKNYEIESIPQKIYNLYKQIVNISKEDN